MHLPYGPVSAAATLQFKPAAAVQPTTATMTTLYRYIYIYRITVGHRERPICRLSEACCLLLLMSYSFS